MDPSIWQIMIGGVITIIAAILPSRLLPHGSRVKLKTDLEIMNLIGQDHDHYQKLKQSTDILFEKIYGKVIRDETGLESLSSGDQSSERTPLRELNGWAFIIYPIISIGMILYGIRAVREEGWSSDTIFPFYMAAVFGGATLFFLIQYWKGKARIAWT